MRSLIVMVMLATTLSHAAWNGYTETRDLAVSSDGIDFFEIDAGAGSLVVNGVDDASEIKVRAIIRVDDDDDDARDLIDRYLVLKLETKRGKATLDSYFEGSFWHNDDAAVDLEVMVPNGLEIFVDDGSGPLHIEDLASVVGIDDGSGPISVINVASVEIDDGSGGIDVKNVERDLEIVDDGSGSVRLADIRGSVRQAD